MVTHPLLPTDLRRSTTYIGWVRSHDRDAEDAARALLDEVRASISTAYPTMKRCVDRLEPRAHVLPPAHQPWFWDTVAHLLAADHGRTAAGAYARARGAERDHALSIDADWRRANALLLAAAGALPLKELADHQRWLAAHLAPADAHTEYVRLLTDWAASPAGLPPDLARRVQASTRTAGLDGAEEARLLGRLLSSARGQALPDALLEAAATPLAAHRQGPAVLLALLDLFPRSRNDAAAWLRLLLRSGAADAVAAGDITPEGGPGAWLRRYTRTYSHRPLSGGGVTRQPMPGELFEIVSRFAPRLRAADTPVRLHEDQYHHPGLDAGLLDLCLAEGIKVEDPGDVVRLELWDPRVSSRDLRALAADPVFGPRLEGTVHAMLRGTGTAITRLPGNPAIVAAVRTRVENLLEAVHSGGLAAADEAVEELTALLDRPTAEALDHVEDALGRLDLVGPLSRALRSGLPEELCWPALEEVLESFDPHEGLRVTCTWPVLTVYSRDRAVAVDHAGALASCAFRVPDDAATHTVHFVGGHFLVSWTADDRAHWDALAFWCDRPDEVFTPEHTGGLLPYSGVLDGAFGFQFETPDRGGRFDGERVLRPGGREGIGDRELQLSDGDRFWSAEVFQQDGAWTCHDTANGTQSADSSLPDFHRYHAVPSGLEAFEDGRTLAVLPEGAPDSPLGQDGRLVGCRVLNDTSYVGSSPTDFLLETVDGRSARYRSPRSGRRPWGIIQLPAGGEDAVLTGEETIRCHSTVDNSLLWQVRGFVPAQERVHDLRPTFGEGSDAVPPPAFWHFLTSRDDHASAALRVVTSGTVRSLLDATCDTPDDERLRAEAARLLPEVTSPRLLDGVLRAARLAADVVRRRRDLSRRVGVMRSGPVVTLPVEAPDAILVDALAGLLPLPEHHPFDVRQPEWRPGILTAIAADGRHLRGEIDDESRRLAPPAPPAEWQALLGGIDAVAWRAAVGVMPDDERDALLALLATWRGQPFAEPGSAWRTGRAPQEELAACRAAGQTVASGTVRDGLAPFVQSAADPAPARTEECGTVAVRHDDAARLTRIADLIDSHGPLVPTPEAVALFSSGTGVARPVAALVLSGLPDHRHRDDQLKAMPYRANRATTHEYDNLWHVLKPMGRRALLAAGMPSDPADLWTPDGMNRAAERMAAIL